MSIILNALKKIERHHSIDMDPVARQEIAKEQSSFLKRKIMKWILGILIISIVFLSGFLLAKKELKPASAPVKEATLLATTIIAPPPIALPTPTPPVVIEKPLSPITPLPTPEATPNLVLAEEKIIAPLQADIVKNDGTSPLTLLNIITQLISTNQIDHALALLSTYQDQASSYLAVVKQLGVSLADGNRNEIAIQILNAALLRYPEEIEIRQYLASAQMGQGKYAEAIKTLLINQPSITQHASYYALLAAIYLKTGDYTNATSLYEALTQIEPDNPNFYLGLAIAYQDKGSNTIAQNYYEKALKLAPGTWSSRSYVLNQLVSMGVEV